MPLEIQIPSKWEPRIYQEDVWFYFQAGGRFACTCWHRRAGKDLLAINLIATKMMERPGLYWHIFPTLAQGRKIVWDGVTKAGRPFLDHFPGYRNPGAEDSLCESVRQDMMQVKFKPTPDPKTGVMRETGGTYQIVGLDDPDSLVGPNPFGLVFSEWSISPERAWHLLKPMLNENGGWALFIFTMRQRNHAFQMLQRAKANAERMKDAPPSKKWFAQLLNIEDTYQLLPTGEVDEITKLEIMEPVPIVTQEQIEADREEGIPEATIRSEYYGDPDSPTLGSYYGEIINKLNKLGRITSVPWDPFAEVNTLWDIGHDSTDIIWLQIIGSEVHVLDHYENQGEGFPHYATKLREKQDAYGYVYGTHYGPHDLQQREFMAGGETKLAMAKRLGVKFRLVKKHTLEDGIEATRSFLMRCWFDKEKCSNEKTGRGLLEALRAYQKEYDEKNEVFKQTPLHNWASHPADALRQGAVGLNHHIGFLERKKKMSTTAITDYNEFQH